MIRTILTYALLTFCLLVVWQPLVADDQDLQATLQQMRDLLTQQQEQLDEQRQELAAQRLLIKQLQGASQASQPSTEVPDVVYPQEDSSTVTAKQDEADAPIASEDQSGQQKAVLALANQQVGVDSAKDKQLEKKQDQKEISRKAFYDPSNTSYDPNFPGAWYLPGTTAAMKVGGYVNLALVHSFDPMLITDRFIVGSIPPAGETVNGAEEGTQVSAQQTRINLEYREQTTQGEIRAFVEGDFQGADDTFRLRHAFGQFRSILAGKTSSTFMDINSQPEEVDVEGINGQVLLRNSQIRWTPHFGETLNLRLALEDPATDINDGQGQRGAFDIVASLERVPLGVLGHWNYRVGAILRDLAAIASDDESVISEKTRHTTGWGVTTGGRQPLSWWAEDDYLLWQLTYGEGIGRYINDLGTVGGGDAVFDLTGKLRALPVFSGYVSYMHRWPLTWRPIKAWPGVLRSSFTFSWVDISNFDFQPGSDYNKTLRASINLIYNPTKNIQGGIEYLWGQRTNKDGSKGKATQLQFAMRYIF